MKLSHHGPRRTALERFVDQMAHLRPLGPLGRLVVLLPGFGSIRRRMAAAAPDPTFIRSAAAIMTSMTGKERRHPEIVESRRAARIALGTGVRLQTVHELLRRFEQAR